MIADELLEDTTPEGVVPLGQLYTVEQVATYLQLNTMTVMRYAKSGALGSIKFGRAVRFSKQQLEDFVNSFTRVGA